MYYFLLIPEQAILQNTALIFQEFTTMSKITHMKKLIEYQYVFRRYFKVIQEVNDEIQTNFYYIKDELQNSIDNNIIVKTRKKKNVWLNGDGLKELLTMNPMVKHIKK